MKIEDVKVGMRVRVHETPFESIEGTVESIDSWGGLVRFFLRVDINKVVVTVRDTRPAFTPINRKVQLLELENGESSNEPDPFERSSPKGLDDEDHDFWVSISKDKETGTVHAVLSAWTVDGWAVMDRSEAPAGEHQFDQLVETMERMEADLTLLRLKLRQLGRVHRGPY